MRHWLNRILILTGALLLSACGTPYATVPNKAGEPVMLLGHDPVAYFTQGKFAQGSPQYRSSYQGVDFRFASAEHKALFDKEPAKYLPQYGGYCANGIVYGIPWGGDADTWLMIDGKLYICLLYTSPSPRD